MQYNVIYMILYLVFIAIIYCIGYTQTVWKKNHLLQFYNIKKITIDIHKITQLNISK